MNIENKIQVVCEKLEEQRYRKLFDVENVEFMEADGYKKNNDIPRDGWKTLCPEQAFSGVDNHYWIKAEFKTPKTGGEKYLVLKTTTGREGEWDATNPQGLLYLNGYMVQGLDTNHTEVLLEPDKEYTAHNYFYVGMIDQSVKVSVSVLEYDRKIEQLYFDFKTALDVCRVLEKNSKDYYSVINVLDRAAVLLDMRQVYSENYYNSVEKAIEFINTELYEKLCSTDGKPIVNCIGHTHIDVEWLWAREQTREKIQRSFSTAANLMKQYPDYKFMLSQPELYRYLKEEAPEKYEELKELVKSGRWEPEGGMYLEADCNLISGESFVRQFLHGKRFFKEEFGKDSRILFLPDVFGYSAALPQILKKSGIDYFITSKISWNDTNTVPVDTFMWEGIDGSEVFTNFITSQDYKRGAPERGTTYIGYLTPTAIKGTWERFQQKEFSNRVLHPFGFGDGGGGPTKEMLESYKRLEKGFPDMPVVKMEFVLDHLESKKSEFDERCKELNRIPRWVGELYLEYHRGTYTSMAKNKRGNRKAEFALMKAEGLSYISKLFGGEYDSLGINSNWRRVLHNQFHDIIPGSSIKRVYEHSDRDYEKIGQYTDALISEKLKMISENVSSDGGTLVYNPLGFKTAGILKIDGKTVETEEIPSFGYKVLNDIKTESRVKISKLKAENEYYVLILDKAGRISSLYDKIAGREVFKENAFGNEIQVFEDMPILYDAWEISDYYKQKMWVLDDEAKIEPIFDGSRAGFAITKTYMNSVINQNIWLYSKSKRIDIENDIDWHEQHQLLKAAFPFDIHATEAKYEIQYGHVTRPTHSNTSWDEAKFEVYGHKWVDISDGGYGVALLNDCKYGHNAEGSTIKLSMLKCATYPNPEADQGRHMFTYSLLPHIGDFRTAGVIHEAYRLNQPFESVTVDKKSGKLGSEFSLVSQNRDNVIIETVKKAEDDDSLIVRMYEAFDSRCDVTVETAGEFKQAYLCDLMENIIEPLEFSENRVKLSIKNFEIVTLKFC